MSDTVYLLETAADLEGRGFHGAANSLRRLLRERDEARAGLSYALNSLRRLVTDVETYGSPRTHELALADAHRLLAVLSPKGVAPKDNVEAYVQSLLDEGVPDA